ncbi:MAG: NADH-quinone oxidoreductase subunit B family protein [Proteobacteria bacterium]|nr:NADH-quinone oxidoreductase subunit B family protein [Pseudomonadota bacterium]
MVKILAKSPWVVHFNCNSCNGCDIEFLACLTPLYDLERFGVLHIGNPKHADILVVTGSVNHRNARVLENVYLQIPDPKVVVAIGVCTSTGGIFADCYNILGGIDKVIPVDVFIPGCPPRPEAIIDGLVQSLEKLEAKRAGKKVAPARKPTFTFRPPEEAEAPVTPSPAGSAGHGGKE